jgi:hypothetical protein
MPHPALIGGIPETNADYLSKMQGRCRDNPNPVYRDIDDLGVDDGITGVHFYGAICSLTHRAATLPGRRSRSHFFEAHSPSELCHTNSAFQRQYQLKAVDTNINSYRRPTATGFQVD